MIRQIIGKAANKVLNLFDLRLSRVSTAPQDVLGRDAVFKRLLKRGVKPASVLDIGASDGCWTVHAAKYFPDTRFHLVEANKYHEKSLTEFVSQHSNASYVLAAAADSVGVVYFDDSDPWTGQATYDSRGGRLKPINSTTIDVEVANHSLPAPFLIKLDTHGFEVAIIEGASTTLDETSVIIVETYNFDLTDESLKFWEMCKYLGTKGFRPIDLMEPMFRPKDDAFWQVDLVFVRSDSLEFRSNAYE